MRYDLEPNDFFLKIDSIERKNELRQGDIVYQADGTQQFHSASYAIESVGARDIIRTNFLGLIGAQGDLPTHYTDTVLRLLKNKNGSLSDFYAVFHHRLISLFYQAWRGNQLTVDYRSAMAEKRYARFMNGLLGCVETETEELHRHPVLHFNPVHNQAKLKSILQDLIPDQVEIVLGQAWKEPIPKHAQGQLHSKAALCKNMCVGQDWLLGKSMRMDHVFFKVKIMIRDTFRYCQLVRTDAFRSRLATLVKGYVGNAYRFVVDVVFVGVPDMLVLSASGSDGFRLGKTSFLIAGK